MLDMSVFIADKYKNNLMVVNCLCLTVNMNLNPALKQFHVRSLSLTSLCSQNTAALVIKRGR